MPSVARMVRHAELEASLPHQRRPGTDDVPLRPDSRGVPLVMLAREQVEIVVMAAHRHEVASARFDVAFEQLLGLPRFRLPLTDDVDESRAARMAVAPQMIFVRSLAVLPRHAALQV